jgi:hypothetical protein
VKRSRDKGTAGALPLTAASVIESARCLAQNQPRCHYCLKYFMTDRSLNDHINKKHPNGPTAICNWNNSGCHKRIQIPTVLKNHIEYEHEHAPFPVRTQWARPQIEGTALPRCNVCGDDFLAIGMHQKMCGKYHQCSVCNLRFNRWDARCSFRTSQ